MVMILQKMILIVLFVAPTLAEASKLLIDQNGREVNIPEQVDKVVSLTIPGASMLVTLDQGTDRLVGINPISKQETTYGLLAKLFPSYASIPANMAGEGFAPNVEAIVRVNPDLVLQWGDQGEAILKPLEAMGLNVLTFRYGQTDYAATWLRLIGDATGREHRSTSLASWILSEQEKIKMTLASYPELHKPKILYIHRYQGGIMVGGKGSNMGYDIELVGGINVAGNTKGLSFVSKEQIVAWNPDFILLSSGDPGLKASTLLNDPILADINAVQKNQVYKFPRGGFRWDPPSQETPLSWRWLSGLVHPSIFPLTDFRQYVVSAYDDLYGQKISDDDVDHILNMSVNGTSSGYDALRRME